MPQFIFCFFKGLSAVQILKSEVSVTGIDRGIESNGTTATSLDRTV